MHRVAVMLFLSPLILTSYKAHSQAVNEPRPEQTAAATTSSANAVLLQALTSIGTLTTIGPDTQIHFAGTVSYNWAGTQVPGNLSGSWDSKNGLQVTAVTSLGSRTEVTNGQEIVWTDEMHRVVTLGSHTAARSQLRYLPSLDLATILAFSQKQLTLDTPTQVNGSTVDVVHISGVWPTNSSIMSDGEVTLYLDTGTHMILRRDDRIEASAFSPGKLTRTMMYSDYRKTGVIFVPFTISEVLNGQVLYTISIASFSIQ